MAEIIILAERGRQHEEWAPLSESTIRGEQAHGFKKPAPLLRTGEMRDSIEYVVDGNLAAGPPGRPTPTRARRRGLHRDELAASILRNVIFDDLYAAVVDR
jgi:hypothetical protein